MLERGDDAAILTVEGGEEGSLRKRDFPFGSARVLALAAGFPWQGFEALLGNTATEIPSGFCERDNLNEIFAALPLIAL